MTWFDRLVGWLSPEWAWRRKQFKDALETDAAPRRPDRTPDDVGWVRWEDPNNPLHPDHLASSRVAREERRRDRWFAS